MMLTDTQRAILPARAQLIDRIARAFDEGNPAALDDIHWGDCSQYLLSELANALLELKEAAVECGELRGRLAEARDVLAASYCPVCGRGLADDGHVWHTGDCPLREEE